MSDRELRDSSSRFTAGSCSGDARPVISTITLLLPPGLLALLLYLNTLHADFVYDDNRAILKNDDLLPDSALLNVFYNDFWGTPLTHSGSHRSYRPLCVITFRLNYAIGGHDPFGYHLINVLLHSIVTMLCIYVINEVVGDRAVATTSGFLFASHPIHTEAVAGIVGRADVIAALFFLISFLCYVRYCRLRDEHVHQSLTNRHADGSSDQNSAHLWRYFFGAAVFALVAMFSKEHGIMVICVCAIFEVVSHSSLSFKNMLLLFRTPRQQILEGLCGLTIVGLFAILLRVKLMGYKAPEFASSDNPASESDSFVTRTLTYWFLPCFNFWLLLCPAELSFDWSMDSLPLVERLCDVRNAVTLIVTVSLCIVPIYSVYGRSNVKGQKNKTITHRSKAFCIGEMENNSSTMGDYSEIRHWTSSNGCNTDNKKVVNLSNFSHVADLLTHRSKSCANLGFNSLQQSRCVLLSAALLIIPFIPATNLFFYVGFVVAERVLYIPSIGFCFLVALGVQSLYIRARFLPHVKVLIFMLVFGLVVTNSIRTVLRNMDWQSEYTLYASGTKINPAKAWGNLGNVLKAQGNLSAAEQAYRKALTYRANMADAHYNLGILLQEESRFQDSIICYQNAIRCRPKLTPAYLNLGIVYLTLGMTIDAEAMFRQCNSTDTTGQKDPKLHAHTKISALYHLGRLLADDNRVQEAIDIYREAIDLSPSDYSTHSLYNMLGEAYSKLGHMSDAESCYRQSLLIKPDHIPAHLTLARLLHQNNQPVQAEELFVKALQLNPDEANVYQLYGSFLTDVGRHSEAADRYIRSAELLPNSFETIFNAANVLRQANRNAEAEEFYRRAVQLRPQEIVALMNLGAMLHYSGKLSEAESVYIEALKINPTDEVLLSNYNKLMRLIEKHKLL